MTAAATTGPAIGPTPASSTPATAARPCFHNCRSYLRFARPATVAPPSPLCASRQPLEPRLAQNFRHPFGILNIEHLDHEIAARRRRDFDVAESQHPLHRAAFDFDRAHVGKLHLAPPRRDKAVPLDYPVRSQAPTRIAAQQADARD